MRTIVTPIDKKMDEWVEVLAKRLSEIQLWDMEQIKDAISFHLTMAIQDCTKIQLSDTDRRIKQVKIKMANWSGGNMQPLIVELHNLKEKLAEEKLLLKAANSLTGLRATRMKGTAYLTLVCDVLRERFDEAYVKQLLAEAKEKQQSNPTPRP